LGEQSVGISFLEGVGSKIDIYTFKSTYIILSPESTHIGLQVGPLDLHQFSGEDCGTLHTA